MNTAKIFVTQVPHRRDNGTGSYVPIFNLTPATEFGDLITMMPPKAAYTATGDLVRQLEEKLEDYRYEEGDAVLLLGDTSIIAATVAILARKHLKFAVLRWDRVIGRYSRVVFNFGVV